MHYTGTHGIVVGLGDTVCGLGPLVTVKWDLWGLSSVPLEAVSSQVGRHREPISSKLPTQEPRKSRSMQLDMFGA